MDKFHIGLMILLGISIIFLGVSSLDSSSDLSFDSTKEELEIWGGDVTPDDINNIADHDWIARLKSIDGTGIEGTEKVCLNMCGNRCIWLGYTYKDHIVKPGKFPWGDKENAVCSCECYIIKQ